VFLVDVRDYSLPRPWDRGPKKLALKKGFRFKRKEVAVFVQHWALRKVPRAKCVFLIYADGSLLNCSLAKQGGRLCTALGSSERFEEPLELFTCETRWQALYSIWALLKGSKSQMYFLIYTDGTLLNCSLAKQGGRLCPALGSSEKFDSQLQLLVLCRHVHRVVLAGCEVIVHKVNICEQD